MSGSTTGTLFKVTTFGESHGKAVGVVVDGVPACLNLDLEAIQRELDRRRPGQSKLVTQRQEADKVEILSGVFEGKTTGAPICALVFNADARSKDYEDIKDLFRPGHADFSYFAKYGHRDYRGGGRSSARETIARVIAGSIARQILAVEGISFVAGIVQVGNVRARKCDWSFVEKNDVRTVDPDVVNQMTEVIEQARRNRDSVGAIVEVQAIGVSPGLGEPVFNKLDAVIAGAMMSLPATKGVEIGSGFSSVEKPGSENNDVFTPEGFVTNNHGGILGGISTGSPIVVRVAFKPTSSLPQEQKTIDKNFKQALISTKGRHDPCVGLRAVPICEAVLAMVLADFWLQQLARNSAQNLFSSREKIKYGLR